jgi:hypothetical protein
MLRDGNIVKDEAIRTISAKTALNNLPKNDEHNIGVYA